MININKTKNEQDKIVNYAILNGLTIEQPGDTECKARGFGFETR